MKRVRIPLASRRVAVAALLSVLTLAACDLFNPASDDPPIEQPDPPAEQPDPPAEKPDPEPLTFGDATVVPALHSGVVEIMEIDIVLPAAVGGSGPLTYALAQGEVQVTREGTEFDADGDGRKLILMFDPDSRTLTATEPEGQHEKTARKENVGELPFTYTATDQDMQTAELVFDLFAGLTFRGAVVPAQDDGSVIDIVLPAATGSALPVTYTLTVTYTEVANTADIPADGIQFDEDKDMTSTTLAFDPANRRLTSGGTAAYAADLRSDAVFRYQAVDEEGQRATIEFRLFAG